MEFDLNSLSIYQSINSTRPTKAEISLENIKKNFDLISQHVNGSKVIPVLKANAYGHGIIAVAKALESKAKIMAVSFLEEALLLKKAKVKSDLLVFGAFSNLQISEFLNHNLIITIPSVEKLTQVNEIAKKQNKLARIHIKFDIGMERVGVHYYSAHKLFKVIKECSACQVEGIYSHFSESEAKDLAISKQQLERFKNTIDQFFNITNLSQDVIIHVSNSGSILQLPEANFSAVRPGLILYGHAPANHLNTIIPIKPALSLKSKIVYFKVVQQGAGVSYGSTWIAPEQSRIVTIPIGYGDGYPRELSNQGKVIIGNKIFPIVGRVCMDQLMVNISNSEAFNNDEVILIGSSGDLKIDAKEIAEICKTDTRDILCRINSRVPRVYSN